MNPNLRISVIPFHRVEESQHTSRASFKDNQEFNTHGHGLEEVQQALPSLEHLSPDPLMPWLLLSPWLDLVMESQGLPNAAVHKVELPSLFLEAMAPISSLSFYKGRLAGDAEDLQFLSDSFAKTTIAGVDLNELLSKGTYFAHLDTCSLKDALAGKGPVKDLEDLWKRIVTSIRGVEGIKALKAASDRTLYVYLFKWNPKMSLEMEYRVFCAPRSGRITAISQYRWFDRWYHAEETLQEQKEIAKRVFENAKIIHQQIMQHPATTEDLKKRGFVYDILEDPANDNATCLIELNHFGAMTGCGACLFHWLNDARILYGLEEAVTFRVTV